MSTVIEPLESLQDALDPLGTLQSEQAELGSWIHDSFSALEKLHEELTQWQSELARKETDLDLRQDALGRFKTTDKELQKQVTELEEQLAVSQESSRQFEQRNGEQLRELERIEVRCGELEVQHNVACERITELEATLAAERQRSASESEVWKKEFQSLRRDLEKYYQLLTDQVEKVAASVSHDAHTPLSAGAAHAKCAELRRRAQSRRDNKDRINHSAENSRN